MKITFLYIMLMILSVDVYAQNPVLLQPWVEVFGDTNGESLGSQVTGFIPTLNFPYKAGVTQAGKTGLYKLQNQSDKNPYGFVLGDNIKLADLNGDGYVDMIFSKSGEYVAPDTVFIYWGTQNGLDSINTTKLIGEDKYDGFGSSICVGNIVGDSTTDLVVSAPYYPHSAAIGKIYIYKGSHQFSSIPYKILLGDSINYSYGWNCAIGDINNDSINDLIIRGYYQTSPNRYAYLDIYWGSASFDTIRDVRIIGKDISKKGLACFDVNGDGINDLLWTNRDSADWVYVHYGGKNFSTTPSLRLKDPGGVVYGEVIINAGDMNGDGYNDIAVGTREGQVTSYVYIYSGGPKINGELDAYYELSQSDFGRTVAGIGDVNGDGLSDIIVGAPDYPNVDQAKGYWGIFLGSKNIGVTSVKKEEPQQPQFFELYQNYPNPFNGQTVISYKIENEANIKIKITNTLGQEISILNEGEKQAGLHQRLFDSKNLASGWYVYTIIVIPKNNFQTYTQSKAMILEK